MLEPMSQGGSPIPLPQTLSSPAFEQHQTAIPPTERLSQAMCVSFRWRTSGSAGMHTALQSVSHRAQVKQSTTTQDARSLKPFHNMLTQ